MPKDLMPVVTLKDEYTPATYNTPELSEKLLVEFAQRFGQNRVLKAPPVMGGEDFGRFYRADKNIESVIFWVGGVPQDMWDKAQLGKTSLPSLHSPFWAPEAETVISTASQALTTAAMTLMKK